MSAAALTAVLAVTAALVAAVPAPLPRRVAAERVAAERVAAERVAASPGAGRGRASRRRRTALVAVAGSVLAAPLLPPLPVAVAVGMWARPRLVRRRAAWHRRRAVVRGLPDVVDLLRLCTDGGLSVPLALPLVAPRAAPPLGEALLRAHREALTGRPLAEAVVDALAPLGERSRGLAAALADHLRYGTPLTPLLDRHALELRLARRRDAELAARKVPVRLLLPLVVCILPAFGLLTVVPLLAGSLRGLPL